MNTINETNPTCNDNNLICKNCICSSCVKPKTQCDKCEKCSQFNRKSRIVLSCEDYIKDTDEAKKLSFDMHVDETIRSVSEYSSNINPYLKDKMKEYDDLINSINDLIINGYNTTTDDPELNTYQIARQDEIENSIYELLTIITCNKNLKWDMELIGPIADMIVEFLSNKGYVIYYPTIVNQKDGTRTISNFYLT